MCRSICGRLRALRPAALHVNLGDTVKFTLINEGQIEHSIDFHAAQTPWNINYKSIKPGEQLSFDWKANYPGVFMYHCGTRPCCITSATACTERSSFQRPT